ncbi:MAG: FAD/NAD(P)-binding protein [Planctomycetota bacterium]
MILETAKEGARLMRDPMVPECLRISRVVRETHDTFTLELDVGERSGGFSFTPGQFNMLYLFGAGEVPISISGDPGEPGRLIHTIRAAGTVTRAMASIQGGGQLGVRGPYGQGWPMEEAKGHDVLLMAGGIGLAPLRPAIYHILRHRDWFGRVVVLYGTRTPADVLFSRELEKWRGRLDVSLHATVDRGGREWRGHVGVVTSLLPLVKFEPADTVAMLCGPEIMMRFGARDLVARGIPQESMFLSMERNMKCAIGFCGHCQYGPSFVCKDGPVYRMDQVTPLLNVREI